MTIVNQLLLDAAKFPVLHRKDEQDLAQDWRWNQNRKSFDCLVNSNLRFVVRLAIRYNTSNKFQLEDLVQEGIIGLMKCLDSFDPSLGFRLITYAKMPILSAIHESTKRQGRIVEIDHGAAEYEEFDPDKKPEFEISEKLLQLISELSEVEQRIIINNVMYETESLKTIATSSGNTKQKIDQLHKLAIRKLKNTYIKN